MSAKFFYDTDGISPQTIVEVAFVENVIDPTIFVETLLSWKDRPAQHPGINLPYYQTSAKWEVGDNSTSLKPGYSPTVEFAGCG